MFSLKQKAHYVPAGEGEALFVGGGLGITYKVLSSSVGGSASVVEHTLQPKVLAAPPHKHTHEDEISYVAEGVIGFLQGTEVVVASVGAYIVKPRGIFHTFWNAGTETARMIEVIAPGGFENYFRELEPLLPTDAPPDMSAVIALARRYGLEFAMDRVPELLQIYGLKLG